MSEAGALPRLQLRRNEDRRIRQGHHWVYSNEIDTAATPLKQFTAGEQVQLCTASGKPLGVAFVNPHSLICARVLDRHVDVPPEWREALTRITREAVSNAVRHGGARTGRSSNS